jgi:hypothetical protein
MTNSIWTSTREREKVPSHMKERVRMKRNPPNCT